MYKHYINEKTKSKNKGEIIEGDYFESSTRFGLICLWLFSSSIEVYSDLSWHNIIFVFFIVVMLSSL